MNDDTRTIFSVGTIMAFVGLAIASLYNFAALLGIIGPETSPPPAVAAPSAEGTYHPTGAELEELLERVRVAEERPDVAGYDRECGTDHGCVFGQPWSDDVDVELGHNGCDTRNDILARDLVDIEVRAGTNGCVVIAGLLEDPYTGQPIAFTKEKAYEVGVDHLYPLARAWDLGAASWSEQRRQDFANDPDNLLAVSGSANSSKSDRGPGEWLPVNASYRCAYVAGYLEVAITYDLPVTREDHDAAATLAPRCLVGEQ